MTGVPADYAAVEAAAPGRVRRDVPLAPLSAYKVGGAADLFAEPETREELVALLQASHAASVPFHVLGAGTNLLVRDGGVRGVVIRLGRPFRAVEVDGHRVRAGAQAPMGKAALAAERAGLAGLTFGFDIPGTVGGALTMNAGAHGTEVRDVLEEAVGISPDGRVVHVPASGIRFAYRTAIYPEPLVFVEGVFALQPGDAEALAATRKENHAYRLATQPKGNSVGSVFINPDGDHAGRLIEAAGLKGYRRGGAAVSDKHANWILNVDGACAADIEGIITLIQETVRERFGVTLHPEVRIFGEPDGDARP